MDRINDSKIHFKISLVAGKCRSLQNLLFFLLINNIIEVKEIDKRQRE